MSASITAPIRVYIYTAVNGFAWQGCDDALAESLDACLGRGADAVGGVAPLGGVRRGVVGESNGTAIFRCHIRPHGDFAGRDCKYVALAFFPFELLGSKRSLDYCAIWNHRYLATCLPTSEPLDNLFIDLNQDILLPDPKSLNDPFWTTEKSGEEIGSTAEILGRLGVWFQSRKTELGPFSARINAAGNSEDRLAVSWKFSPFPAVTTEATCADNVRRLRRSGDAEGEEKAKAIREWEKAIGALEKLAVGSEGPFRDFIGLRHYVKSERDDLQGGDPTRKAREKMAVETVNNVETIVGKLFRNSLSGTAEERSAIDFLQQVLNRQRNIVNEYPEPDKAILQSIENAAGKLAKVMEEVNAIEKWRTSENIASSEAPNGTSKALTTLAGKLSECVKKLSEKEAELLGMKHERDAQEEGQSVGDSVDQPGDLPPQTDDSGSPATASQPAPDARGKRKRHGRKMPRWFRRCLLGLLVVAVLFGVEMLLHLAMDSWRNASAVERTRAAPPQGEGQP